ncbi:MAG TPA: DUF732 domain-containing protein [Mycobacterium sp.]|nr:DUF732 domain-containing protein [Mycobacterium sp.]
MRPAGTIGVIALGVVVAAGSATPARADMVGNSFLAALTDAGIHYNDPASATALGQSVCPMLVQPGGTFDSVATGMADNSGMRRETAEFFTLIAISVYCPGLISLSLPDRFN